MLVLTRGEQQEVILTGRGTCRLKILSIYEGQVRLGFDADQSIAITRDDAKRRQPKSNDDQPNSH